MEKDGSEEGGNDHGVGETGGEGGQRTEEEERVAVEDAVVAPGQVMLDEVIGEGNLDHRTRLRSHPAPNGHNVRSYHLFLPFSRRYCCRCCCLFSFHPPLPPLFSGKRRLRVSRRRFFSRRLVSHHSPWLAYSHNTIIVRYTLSH